jgi:sterol desaturase/sphingolipid hydroxylase (fatty acid hydroxylase superfamily)
MQDLFIALAGNWFTNVTGEAVRYAAVALAVWLVLSVLFVGVTKTRKIRPASPPTKQLITEFLVSLRSTAIFATLALIPFGLQHAGVLTGPAIAASWGPLWFGASLVLMMLAHDAYFYWAHRIMHDPRLFRRFHRRHHRSNNPSPFTSYSFDIGEAVVMGGFVQLWVLLVPTPLPVVGLFILQQILHNTLSHSGYEVMPARKDGRPLFDWIAAVTHHDLHHGQAGWNYGLYFTWWDRWMGTEHPEYHARFARAVGKRLSARQEPTSPNFEISR